MEAILAYLRTQDDLRRRAGQEGHLLGSDRLPAVAADRRHRLVRLDAGRRRRHRVARRRRVDRRRAIRRRATAARCPSKYRLQDAKLRPAPN